MEDNNSNPENDLLIVAERVGYNRASVEYQSSIASLQRRLDAANEELLQKDMREKRLEYSYLQRIAIYAAHHAETAHECSHCGLPCVPARGEHPLN